MKLQILTKSGMFAISASFALTMACGGSDSGGGFSTSVPSSQQLGSLSDADTTKLCNDIKSYQTSLNSQLKALSCKTSGLFGAAFAQPATDAEAQSACKTAYDKCVAAPAQSDGDDACTPPPASCTATVGELTACMNDLPGYITSASNAIPSCASLKLSDLMSTTDPSDSVKEPASCTSYEAKCPDDDMLPGGM